MKRNRKFWIGCIGLFILITGVAGVREFNRVREVFLEPSITSSFEHAISAGYLPTAKQGSQDFTLPLTAGAQDSKASYLKELPPGRYRMTFSTRDENEMFTVLKLEAQESRYVCSGNVRRQSIP